jgi:predicted RND superfamily exporter protein|tara:strand:+ start:92871 stop:95468 length:2598 start_codon:yes stop_codon:yes gene_type:complete
MNIKLLKGFENIYSLLVLKRPIFALLLILAVVALASMGLPNVKLDASSDSLTLESDRAIDFFREINDRYSSGSILVVTYQVDDDLYSAQSLATLKSLRDELAELDRVASVQSIVDVPLLYSPIVGLSGLSLDLPTLLEPGVDLDLVRQEFHLNPIYRDTLVSPDNKTTAVIINLEVDRQGIDLVRERDALLLEQNQSELNDSKLQRLELVSSEYLEHRTLATARDSERVEQVRAIVETYRDRANLFVGGADMVTADMLTFIRSDMINFGLGIFAFIIATLIIIFRQPKLVILPVLNCAFSLMIMLGFLGWIDWRLSVISSNFTLILMIVTLALSVHLIVRFQEVCRNNPESPLEDRVRTMVWTMLRPCFYTVLTTIVAFVSLVVSDIRPVIDFGWMMTIGICIALIQTFFLIPAGLMIMGGNYHGGSEKEPQYTLVFARIADRRSGLVFGMALIFALVSVYGLSRLTVENRFIDYFKSTTEIYQGMEVIDRNLGGTMSLDVIIDAPAGWSDRPEVVQVSDSFSTDEADLFGGDGFGDGEYLFADDPFDDDLFAEDDLFASDGFGDEKMADAEEFSYWWNRTEISTIEAMHSYLESLPDVGKVNSLATATEMAADQTGSALNDIELIFLRKNLGSDLEDTLINAYLDDEIGQTRIATRVKETGDELQRDALITQVQEYAVRELGLAPEQVRVTGLIVLYNNVLQSLFGSQIQTLAAVFFGVMLMFSLLFRSIPISLIAIVPNFLAAGIVLGALGLFGIPLDLMTITIAAISVGMGVDNSIHYIHRFRTELAVDGDYQAAMHRSHATIGRALIYTATTIIAGFSLLSLSNFIPSIYFGLFTSLAMVAALLGSLTLLPAMLVLFKPMR